jgi:hypothetical protein
MLFGFEELKRTPHCAPNPDFGFETQIKPPSSGILKLAIISSKQISTTSETSKKQRDNGCNHNNRATTQSYE